MPADETDRHSKAEEVELITDPDERARQEAKNGLLQFDLAIEQVEYWLHPDRPFKLRLSSIMALNRRALEGIHRLAGVFRPGKIGIVGSKHIPPESWAVPACVEEMCDSVNDHWKERSPVHLAGYVMWRMNWIHPFSDGNGRTARTTSYVVLCLALGYRLPGTVAIPELIARNKKPYYKALESADDTDGKDISAIEELLGNLLAEQLASVLKAARTSDPAAPAV